MNVPQGLLGLTLIFLLQQLEIVQGANALAPYYIKTSTIECFGNPKLLVNITCRLKPINWEKTVAIMDSDLVGLIKNASLRLELFKYTNQFRPFLINVTLNLCDMLERRKGNAYVQMAVRMFRLFTSINHSCPYTGHLGAHGVYLDSAFIPFMIPSGKYKMVFTFYEGWPYEHIGTVIVIGTVLQENETRTAKRRPPKNGTRTWMPPATNN